MNDILREGLRRWGPGGRVTLDYPRKLLYLDFDGVLTNEASGTRPRQYHNDYADANCVAALNRITDATGAGIVVSSSWRMDGLSDLTTLLRQWGVTGKVIDTTPFVPGHPFDAPRGDEINLHLQWINLHLINRPDAFVILDDESISDANLQPHWVRTVFASGLTENDADKAIAILNRIEIAESV